MLRARQVFDLVPVEIRPTNRIHVEAILAFSFVVYLSLVKLDRKKLDCGISRKGKFLSKLNWNDCGNIGNFLTRDQKTLVWNVNSKRKRFGND